MSKPIFHETVDMFYNGVMSHMPQALQDRDMASAFVLGSAGTYGVIRGLQWTSKNIVDPYIWSRMPKFVKDRAPSFDKDVLPALEKICATGMAVAPIIYAAIDPQGAKEIMTQHPVYTSGMLGVGAGSIAAVAQDLHRRSIQREIKEVIEEKFE